MEVISRMERAIDYCLEADALEDKPLEFWDSSVAFYTGSQVSDDGGIFLFNLADTRCLSASTCGENGNGDDGTAWVNLRVLDHFNSGQNHIISRDCEAARRSKDEIVRLMSIPLVQGTLRRARTKEDSENSSEIYSAQGAAFSASILPLVHDCNPEDAETIHHNMHATSEEVDFDEVRDAFGRNLKCLGLSCDEIGHVLELPPNHDFCKHAIGHIEQLDEESEDLAVSHAGAVALYTCITIAAAIICCLSYRIVSGKGGTNNEVSLYGNWIKDPAVAEASETESEGDVIRGTEYAPKYWKDCENNEKDKSTPNHAVDDSVVGEML
mmetsp:Transcript_115442/g.333449  ORF Transcript_115442/g.333449 Transcript_115442/m.333449 type:complete len:325 (+) Transcript_115442:3-977(+)